MFRVATSPAALGPIGRLGRFAATHRSWIFGAWAVLALGMGMLAPRVEHALSGAGWHANGSESAEAREAMDSAFDGAGAYSIQVAVHSDRYEASDPAFAHALDDARATLAASRREGVRKMARASTSCSACASRSAAIQPGSHVRKIASPRRQRALH